MALRILKSASPWATTVLSLFILLSCHKAINTDSVLTPNSYITENVVVLVIDGPRFGDTWGDPEHRLIGNLAKKLAPKGIINQEFYNQGITHTLPGHTAISSGVYERIDNNGKQYPAFPSYLQHWLSLTHENPNKAWIIGSKRKLEVLGNCSNIDWRNSFLPSIDTKDRHDKATFERVKEIITEHHPKLLFINLKGPDFWGHAGDWEMYKYGIFQTDSMLNALQDIIETDPVYSGKTTLIMTNDHGRHLEGIQNGFVSHGDRCVGCTHINFYAYGPDFWPDAIISKQRDQTDIAPTIGKLMGFEMKQNQGEVMTELFKP